MLALPLLILVGLNDLNLAWIVRHLTAGGNTNAGHWLGLVWGSLTVLGLCVALQACKDPAASDPTPWLAINLPATLQLRHSQGQTHRVGVLIQALSERGAVLVEQARERFLKWLYSRPHGWPEREAPQEWRALAALLARCIKPPRRHRLSLVPQQTQRPEAQDKRAFENRIGRSLASANSAGSPADRGCR